MTDFERNVSTKTPRDIEAEGMAAKLSKLDAVGSINLGYPEYVEREVRRLWPEEGYKTPMAFVDSEGNPLIIARHESDDMYEHGVIKEGVDVRYRIYLEALTREVVIPREITGHLVQKPEHGDVSLYDANETGVLELSLRDDASDFMEDLAWLKAQFGDSLAIVRPPLSAARLEQSDGVVAVSLDAFVPFAESDF
jgi:hypothetical protein